MTTPRFPLRARALCALTVRPSIEEITGFRKDGSPIIRRIPQTTPPGGEFEIEDERVYRELIPTGFAELIDEAGNEIPVGRDGHPIAGDA
jgi:hypothetical protein